MSSSNSQVASGGVSIFTVAVVVLFILKVAKVTPYLAKMSWWWVFAPWWIPALAVIGLVIIIGIIVGIAKALN
jgi:hypothetical protein